MRLIFAIATVTTLTACGQNSGYQGQGGGDNGAALMGFGASMLQRPQYTPPSSPQFMPMPQTTVCTQNWGTVTCR